MLNMFHFPNRDVLQRKRNSLCPDIQTIPANFRSWGGGKAEVKGVFKAFPWKELKRVVKEI